MVFMIKQGLNLMLHQSTFPEISNVSKYPECQNSSTDMGQKDFKYLHHNLSYLLFFPFSLLSFLPSFPPFFPPLLRDYILRTLLFKYGLSIFVFNFVSSIHIQCDYWYGWNYIFHFGICFLYVSYLSPHFWDRLGPGTLCCSATADFYKLVYAWVRVPPAG